MLIIAIWDECQFNRNVINCHIFTESFTSKTFLVKSYTKLVEVVRVLLPYSSPKSLNKYKIFTENKRNVHWGISNSKFDVKPKHKVNLLDESC